MDGLATNQTKNFERRKQNERNIKKMEGSATNQRKIDMRSQSERRIKIMGAFATHPRQTN